MSGGYIGLVSIYLDSSSDVYLNIDSESELANTYGTNIVTLIEAQSVGGHSYYLVDINGNFISPNL